MMQQAFAVQAAGAVAVVVTVLLMYQNFGARQLPPVSFTERLAADWDDQFAEHTNRGGQDEAIEKVDRVGVDAALARAAGLTTALDLAVVAKADASPKVAFMFLLEAGTVHEPLWRKYFSEASDQSAYSIYVHTADPEASTVAFADMANSHEIPWTPSRWCALLGLEMVALQEALGDPDNSQFVFVSESAVPLKSLDYAYKDLMRSATSSKLCAAQDDAGSSDCRFGAFKHETGTDGQRGLVKHHQWIVLSREHVSVVLENARSATDENYRYRAIQAALRRDKSSSAVLERDIKLCSDESVPGVALLQHARELGFNSSDTWKDLSQISVEQRCTTFVYWDGCLNHTRFELKKDPEQWKHNVSEASTFHPYSWEEGLDASWVQQLVSERSLLFARKVSENINLKSGGQQTVSLHQFLPTAWAAIDFDTETIVPIPSFSVAGVGLNVGENGNQK